MKEISNGELWSIITDYLTAKQSIENEEDKFGNLEEQMNN